MVQPAEGHLVVHSTPLKGWLRSEGLIDEREFARGGKNLPDVVRQRIRTKAKGEQTDSRVTSFRVIPAEPSENVLPSRLTVEGPCPERFRSVARHLPATLHQVRNGRIFVGHQRTTLILGEDRYFAPVSSSASPWIAPLLARAPAASPIKGTVAVLYANGAGMFSHWMFDLLPKLEILRRAGWTEANVDYFIVNPAAANFQKETLRTLGIAEHKIMACEGFLFEADTLLLPSRIRIGFKTPPWVRTFIRNRFAPPECKGSRGMLKIYISRALARGRRIENEEAIREILERRGYQTVYAENHTVKDFASLIANARTIAAPHGAGLANVVFAPAGIQVLEMYGAQLTQEFWLLTSGVGGQHFLLPGKDRDRSYPWQSAEYPELSYHETNIADYYVAPPDLERALHLMEQSAV